MLRNKKWLKNKFFAYKLPERIKTDSYADKSGAGAEDVEPSLWYFEEMRFLQTQETPTASISTMDISQDNINVANDEPCQKNRRRKAPDPTEELVKLASQRLQQPQDDSDKIAAAWAVELRKMDPQQQLFAKKAISDIPFEGQMGTLHRNSVEINISRVSTPYSIQSLPSITLNTPSFRQYESADSSTQDTGAYFATFQ